MAMADKSKPPPPTDVSPGSILPPGDHYEFSEFGVKHTTIRTYAPTVTVSAYESTASAFSAPKQQAEVLALEPRRFRWKDGSGDYSFGFIAQEMDEVLPEYIVQDGDHLGIRGDLVPVLVNAIKQQQKIIDAMSSEIEEIKKHVYN